MLSSRASAQHDEGPVSIAASRSELPRDTHFIPAEIFVSATVSLSFKKRITLRIYSRRDIRRPGFHARDRNPTRLGASEPVSLREALPSLSNLGTPVKRGTYVTVGITLAILKYFGDALLVWFGTGQIWKPTDYLHILHSFSSGKFSLADNWLILSLLLWTIPFVWVGVTLTMRRALDAGWPPSICFGFFVPFAGYALMALLCLWPSSQKYMLNERARDPREGKFYPGAVAGIGAGIVFGLLMIGIAVALRGNYGVALFLGTPFGIGAVAGYVLCLKSPASTGELMKLTLATTGCIAGVLILFAYEGVVCLVMAFPIAVPLAFLGALVGREMAQGGRAIAPPVISALLLLPVFASVEPAHLTGRTLHEVKSEVVINARPEEVWPRVIAFAPMPEPTELMFRLGIAYPQFARIDGAGIGAIRYCVFSTGPFVEPITAWEPGKRLAFDVASSPEPLRELSWYDDVHPPHLHGYLRSRRGEFRLIELPGGRTRLEGSTWYEIEMAPETYWALWSNTIIHSIHMRVLNHIKNEVESEYRPFPSQ